MNPSPAASGYFAEPPLSPGVGEPSEQPIPLIRTVEPPPLAAAPEPAPAPPPAPAPAAPSAAPAPVATPLEALLLRFRLVTPDQMATAMREETETGKDLATIVVEKGWVSAEDLASVQNYAESRSSQPAAPAPAAPAAAAAPVAEPAPAFEPPPAPAFEPPPAVEPAPPLEPVAQAPAAVAPEAPTEPLPPLRTPEVDHPPATAATVTRVLVRLTTGERVDCGTFEDRQAAHDRARELMRELRGDGEWPFVAGRFVRPEAVVSIDLDILAR